jgi:protein involved in polysaccharide export with SLBB domain
MNKPRRKKLMNKLRRNRLLFYTSVVALAVGITGVLSMISVGSKPSVVAPPMQVAAVPPEPVMQVASVSPVSPADADLELTNERPSEPAMQVSSVPPVSPVNTVVFGMDNEQVFREFAGRLNKEKPTQAKAMSAPKTTGPVLAAATPAPPRAVLAAAPGASSAILYGNDKAEPPSNRSFESGDKIKFLVYERLADSELAKYGKNGFSEQDFQQRTEMSGEFTVAPDETLAIPMLGLFSVTGSTPQQLEAAVATAYQQKMKRAGFVTITSVTRPPILILGPVKTQGKVDFMPNMTVLHALALAGGIKTAFGDDEPWQRMEQIRERINHASARQGMAELLAQRTVLEAERDQIPPRLPDALVTLVGEARANAMVASEQDRRRAIVQARQQQEQGIDAQLQAVRQQAASLQSTNMQMYDEAVRLAERRVNAMTRFQNAGTINNVQLQAAQGELLNAKSRRDEIQTRLTDAKLNIGRLEADKALTEKTARGDLTTTLQAVRQQISANQEKSTASESILRALGGENAINIAYSADTGEGTNSPHWTYRIVRTTNRGPVEFPATDLTVLAPGDLVKVVLGNGSSVSVTKPGGPSLLPVPEHARTTPASATEKR